MRTMTGAELFQAALRIVRENGGPSKFSEHAAYRAMRAARLGGERRLQAEMLVSDLGNRLLKN